MPRKTKETSLDLDLTPEILNPQKIDRICGVFNTGTSRWPKYSFIGWDADGKLCILEGEENLTETALESFKVTLAGEQEVFQNPGSPLTPVKYEASDTPNDLPDKEYKKTEDQLKLVVTKNGEITQVIVKELEMLQALANPLTYHEVPVDVDYTQKVRTTRAQFVVIVPDAINPDTTYAICFNQDIRTQSGSEAFHTFAADIVGSLLAIDDTQAIEAKKGYLRALSNAFKDNLTGEPGLAYYLVKGLQELGDGSESDRAALRELAKDSAGEDLISQTLLVARALGIVNPKILRKEEKSKVSAFETLSDKDLIEFLRFLYSVVKRSF